MEILKERLTIILSKQVNITSEKLYIHNNKTNQEDSKYRLATDRYNHRKPNLPRYCINEVFLLPQLSRVSFPGIVLPIVPECTATNGVDNNKEDKEYDVDDRNPPPITL